ncbi:MAG: quinone-dependent dihydroorotate dehydrogenase [Chitinophagales bacterium]|nr:quinone-dependent dihydroorotate dehydrogenase [Chitinophagales bacterium]
MYFLLRFFLFRLSAEKAHHLTLKLLKWVVKIPGNIRFMRKTYILQDKKLERNLWGLHFKSPVGLAAGLDKNAEAFSELSHFGFGFVEIGTVTPLPQDGNPQPRLFRVVQDKAIINRMGFNNVGLQQVIENIKEGRQKKGGNIILGGNLGRNKITSNDNAVKDYITGLKGLYPYVDYFVVNVSSPNTPNLRELQEKEPLTKLLLELKKVINSMPRKKPILLKIAPDLTKEQLDDIVEILETTDTDGIIATNTTITRDGLTLSKEKIKAIGAGGLSGQPLTDKSTEIIKYLASRTKRPIIAVGGIMNAKDAVEKLKAGASLVQIYTGFVYNGPKLVADINQAIIASTSI